MGNVPQMMTINQAAKETGLSAQYLRRLCRTNQIACIQCGTRFYINVDRLIDFLNHPNQSTAS